MKVRLMLIVCLLLTFVAACQPVLPPPVPSVKTTPTLTATPAPTQTQIPTPTKELTFEEKYGYLVSSHEKVVLANAGEFFIEDTAIPPNTKYTKMQFYATGQSRIEETSLGKVVMIQLVYRDTKGSLQDLWMWYAGYRFGAQKDGVNSISIHESGGSSSIKYGTPEELLDLLCPGTYFDVTVAWKKGALKNVYEICGPSTCNDLMREAYLRIDDDGEELRRLVEGNGVESSDFRLVPFYFSIRNGVLKTSSNGLGWEFELAESASGCTAGWSAGHQITDLLVGQGHLTARSTGNNPYLISPGIQFPGRRITGIEAQAFPRIEIRMKLSSGSTAQLYFTALFPDYTQDYTFDESKSLSFPVLGDGQFHIYTVDMTKVEKWKGSIEQLRLDLTGTRATIEVDYIRFVSRP